MNPIINIDKNKCIGCQLCIKDCPAKNISLNENKATLIDNKCVMCGHCVAICPKNAISINGLDDRLIPKTKEIHLNASDVLDVIRFRRTIRQFTNQTIEHSILENILEAGRLTHTAKNSQNVSFIVLDQEKKKVEQIAVTLFKRIKPIVHLFNSMAKRIELTDNFFFFNAPLVITIVSKDPINGALAAQNMEFVAEAYGLGVLYSGFFSMAANHSRQIKKILGLPRGEKIVTTLVIGYPKVTYQRNAPRNKAKVQYR